MRLSFCMFGATTRQDAHGLAYTMNYHTLNAPTGTAVHNAIKEHTKDLLNGFEQALTKLQEAKE